MFRSASKFAATLVSAAAARRSTVLTSSVATALRRPYNTAAAQVPPFSAVCHLAALPGCFFVSFLAISRPGFHGFHMLA